MTENNEVVSGDLDSTERRLVRQREVNEALVLSSLHAQEETEAAEAREETLLATAELRERLLGILGHDLRSPLSAITTVASALITRGNLNASDGRLAARLLNSANRMDRMITQILDFTRARLGGGMPLEVRPGSDLGQLCRTVAEELALGGSVSVPCSVEGDVTGSWDVDRLAEVISNVVRNAIEHARPGTSVALHVYGEASSVVVVITNEGDPIPPDVLPFIFEPFRRAKQGVYSKAGNLGLGLYIASEITRAHRGTLDARSSDGKTEFTLRLPRFPPPPDVGRTDANNGRRFTRCDDGVKRPPRALPRPAGIE